MIKKSWVIVTLFIQFLYSHEAQEDLGRKNDFRIAINAFHQKQYEFSIKSLIDQMKKYKEDVRMRYFLGLSFYLAGYRHDAISQWEGILNYYKRDAILQNKVDTLKYFSSIDYSDFQFPIDSYIQASSFLKTVTSSENTFWKDNIIDIYTSSKGRIFMIDYFKSILVEKDIEGKIVSTHELFLKHPMSIRGYDEETLIITDYGNNRLIFFNIEENKIKEVIGKKGIGEEPLKMIEFLGPIDVAVDETKNIFVVDSGNSKIKYMSRNGELLYSFGKRGNGEGEIFLPSSIYIYNSEIYVADTYNSRISIFDLRGKYISVFGEDFLIRPKKIDINPLNRNYLIIADDENIYFYDIKEKIHKSIFQDQSDLLNMEILSFSINENGFFFISDGYRKEVGIYLPRKYSYHNLFVNVQSINMSNFPEVGVSIRVKNSVTSQTLKGLKNKHFSFLENGLERKFKILNIDQIYRSHRTSFILENSSDLIFYKEHVKYFLTKYHDFLEEGGDAFKLYSFGEEGDPNGYDRKTDFVTSVPLMNSYIDNLEGVEKYSVGTVLKAAINDLLPYPYYKSIIIFVTQDYKEDKFFPENYRDLLNFARNNGVAVNFVYIGGEDIEEKRYFRYMKEFGEVDFRKSLYVFRNESDIREIIENSKEVNIDYYLTYNSFKNTYLSGDFRPIEVRIDYLNMTGRDDRNGFIIP